MSCRARCRHPIAPAIGGRHHLFGCGITSEGETGCLALPVVSAQKEQPSSKAFVCPECAPTCQGDTCFVRLLVVAAREVQPPGKAFICTFAGSLTEG